MIRRNVYTRARHLIGFEKYTTLSRKVSIKNRYLLAGTLSLPLQGQKNTKSTVTLKIDHTPYTKM